MIKANHIKLPWGFSTGVAGLVWVAAASLSSWDCAAQTCSTFLGAGFFISPLSGSKVVAGQTITITRFSAVSANGNCLFQNGVAYYADPSGAVTQVMTNFIISPGNQIDCNGNAGGGDASCLPLPRTYLVNPADEHSSLTIVRPPRGEFGGATFSYPGAVNEIHFLAAADCDGFDPSGSGRQTDPGF